MFTSNKIKIVFTHVTGNLLLRSYEDNLGTRQVKKVQRILTKFRNRGSFNSHLVGLHGRTELESSVHSSGTKLFLDPKKLVVLGKTF